MRRTFILSAKQEQESLQMTNFNPLPYAFQVAKHVIIFSLQASGQLLQISFRSKRPPCAAGAEVNK